ncbi:hypothetical protein QYF61_001836 [Mycteria americana]|uniref:Uncharacterized protein n=1 Tax=Mycteria americana TaxID=33587 RepID=A0AAN7NDZ0_MYCAM|nr:hypothetical protein QYF61_001836 [Mycteria americana]
MPMAALVRTRPGARLALRGQWCLEWPGARPESILRDTSKPPQLRAGLTVPNLNSSPQRAAIAAWILLHIVSNCPGFYEGWKEKVAVPEVEKEGKMNRRITESYVLEKTFKIIESNHKPNTTKTTTIPCP